MSDGSGKRGRRPSPTKHGTKYAYSRGCRCEQCKVAKAQARRRYNPPTGKPRGIPASPVEHGTTTKYKYGCRCELCKAANTQAMRDYSARYKERHGVTPTQVHRPKGVPTVCIDCGRVRMSGLTERCASCGKKERRRAAARKAKAAVRLAAAAAGTKGWGAWVTGVCAYCGDYFARNSTPSSYCSKRCSSRHRRTKISKVLRLSIYERDGWICQLCMEPVDSALPHTDTWSATLDHIQCVSWALVPDHSAANLRLAHRWCNSVRGDESYYTMSDLVA
jgi:hypothetical protein